MNEEIEKKERKADLGIGGLIVVFAIALAVLIFPIYFYRKEFGTELAHSREQWAQFSDYMGFFIQLCNLLVAGYLSYYLFRLGVVQNQNQILREEIGELKKDRILRSVELEYFRINFTKYLQAISENIIEIESQCSKRRETHSTSLTLFSINAPQPWPEDPEAQSKEVFSAYIESAKDNKRSLVQAKSNVISLFEFHKNAHPNFEEITSHVDVFNRGHVWGLREASQKIDALRSTIKYNPGYYATVKKELGDLVDEVDMQPGSELDLNKFANTAAAIKEALDGINVDPDPLMQLFKISLDVPFAIRTSFLDNDLSNLEKIEASCRKLREELAKIKDGFLWLNEFSDEPNVNRIKVFSDE